MEDLRGPFFGDLEQGDIEDIYPGWLPRSEINLETGGSQGSKNRIKIIQHKKPTSSQRNLVNKFTLAGQKQRSQGRSQELVTAVQSHPMTTQQDIEAAFRKSDAVRTSELLDLFEQDLWFTDGLSFEEQLRLMVESTTSLVQA